MDLNTINTPAELIQQNNEPTAVSLIDSLLDQGPSVGLETVKIILEKLEDLHDSICQKKSDEGETEDALIWQRDLILIQMARQYLSDVEM